jgi:RNA polymerase sigma factor (sigma-70 family)
VDEVSEQVRRAASGDQEAWSGLVDRFADMIWAVARSVGLNASDAADVSQTTWLRFCKHLGNLDDPSRAGAWLATTARREAIRVSRLGARQPVVDPWQWLGRAEAGSDEVDHQLLARERDLMVQYALALLPGRCRALLLAAVEDPPVPYQELAQRLGLAVGSIGPTRGRCLEQLGRLIADFARDIAEGTMSSWVNS